MWGIYIEKRENGDYFGVVAMPHHRWKNVGILRKKEFFKFTYKFGCVAYLAFPYNKNFPAFFAELAKISFISGSIALAFCFPELLVCFRYDTAVFTAVHMPEAAVDKYNLIMISRS